MILGRKTPTITYNYWYGAGCFCFIRIARFQRTLTPYGRNALSGVFFSSLLTYLYREEYTIVIFYINRELCAVAKKAAHLRVDRKQHFLAQSADLVLYYPVKHCHKRDDTTKGKRFIRVMHEKAATMSHLLQSRITIT